MGAENLRYVVRWAKESTGYGETKSDIIQYSEIASGEGEQTGSGRKGYSFGNCRARQSRLLVTVADVKHLLKVPNSKLQS